MPAKHPTPLQVINSERRDKEPKSVAQTRRSHEREIIRSLSLVNRDGWVSISKAIVPELLLRGEKDPVGDKTLLQAVSSEIFQMMQDDTHGLEIDWNDLDFIRYNPSYSYANDPRVVAYEQKKAEEKG
jgi:hypothetical protein